MFFALPVLLLSVIAPVERSTVIESAARLVVTWKSTLSMYALGLP